MAPAAGRSSDPLIGQISEVFPDEVPIDRVSTNAWADIKPAVERQAVNPGLLVRGGGVALSSEYLRANMPVPAGSA